MIVLYQLAELYLSHYIQYKNQLGVFSIFFLFGLLLITHICSKPKKLLHVIIISVCTYLNRNYC